MSYKKIIASPSSYMFEENDFNQYAKEYETYFLQLPYMQRVQASTSLEEVVGFFKETCDGIEQMLSRILDAKLKTKHSDRVAQISLALAQELKLPYPSQLSIYVAAKFHDIGTLLLPDELLKKQKLSAQDWESVKLREYFSEQLINLFDEFAPSAACYAAFHLEKVDGSGHLGLRDGEIPIPALILSIANAYDVMTSKQLHRARAKSPEQAYNEIMQGAGKNFDSDLVEYIVPSWFKKFKQANYILPPIKNMSLFDRFKISLETQSHGSSMLLYKSAIEDLHRILFRFTLHITRKKFTPTHTNQRGYNGLEAAFYNVELGKVIGISPALASTYAIFAAYGHLFIEDKNMKKKDAASLLHKRKLLLKKTQELLSPLKIFDEILSYADFHFERYDGKKNKDGFGIHGYAGDTIPLISRMTNITACFYAKQDFPYIQKNSGTIFDPSITQEAKNLLPTLSAAYRKKHKDNPLF